MVIALVVAAVVVALVVHEVRRWSRLAADLLALGMVAVALRVLWYLVKSVGSLWAWSVRFVVGEVRSW